MAMKGPSETETERHRDTKEIACLSAEGISHLEISTNSSVTKSGSPTCSPLEGVKCGEALAKLWKFSRRMLNPPPPRFLPPSLGIDEHDGCHSGRKFRQEKETQTQTFWSGYLRLGWGVFHAKGWGPKSSVCPSKPRETKLVGRISRDFAPGIFRKCPKSLRKISFVQFSDPKNQPLPKASTISTTPRQGLSGPVLRDTARLSQRYPPIARYGVFGVSTWPIGCDTPSPFLSVSPLESMQSGGAIPPLERGISAILARYPLKTRQMGAIPPLCDTISKGYCAIWWGISHWAAKGKLDFWKGTPRLNIP